MLGFWIVWKLQRLSSQLKQLRLECCEFGECWINWPRGLWDSDQPAKVTELFTPLGGSNVTYMGKSSPALTSSHGVALLCTHFACFWIIGVTWAEGPQSLDGGVSVPADVTEDHPVCFRAGASAWRHHHLRGRSLWPLSYLFIMSLNFLLFHLHWNPLERVWSCDL